MTDNVHTDDEFYASRPRNRGELMQRVDRAWQTLTRTLKTLDAEQLSTRDANGWRVADHLAHISAWEHSAIGLVDGTPRYEALDVDESLYAQRGIDGVNEVLFERCRDRDPQTLLRDFHATHEKLVARFEQLNDTDLLRPYSDFQPGQPSPNRDEPISLFLGGDTYEHYLGHNRAIEAIFSPARE